MFNKSINLSGKDLHLNFMSVTPVVSFLDRCGHTTCQTDQEARYYIYQRDPKLYYALSYVYLNYQYTVPTHLATCVS